MSIWSPPASSVAAGYQAVGEIPTVQVESEPPNDYELSLQGVGFDTHTPFLNLDGLHVATAEGEFVTRTVTVSTPIQTYQIQVTEVDVGAGVQQLQAVVTQDTPLVLEQASDVQIETTPLIDPHVGHAGATVETSPVTISRPPPVETISTSGVATTEGGATGFESSPGQAAGLSETLVYQTTTATTPVYDTVDSSYNQFLAYEQTYGAVNDPVISQPPELWI